MDKLKLKLDLPDDKFYHYDLNSDTCDRYISIAALCEAAGLPKTLPAKETSLEIMFPRLSPLQQHYDLDNGCSDLFMSLRFYTQNPKQSFNFIKAAYRYDLLTAKSDGNGNGNVTKNKKNEEIHLMVKVNNSRYYINIPHYLISSPNTYIKGLTRIGMSTKTYLAQQLSVLDKNKQLSSTSTSRFVLSIRSNYPYLYGYKLLIDCFSRWLNLDDSKFAELVFRVTDGRDKKITLSLTEKETEVIL